MGIMCWRYNGVYQKKKDFFIVLLTMLLCGYPDAIAWNVDSLIVEESQEQEEDEPQHVLEQIRAAIKHEFDGQLFSIALDYPNVLHHLPRHARVISCATMSKNRLQVFIKGMKKPIGAKIEFLARVPVLNKPLSSHHVIERDDITFVTLPLSHLNGAYAMRIDDLLGKQASHKPIHPMQPIPMNDVRAPIIVKRESLLKLSYHVGNIHLSSMGKATRDASLGERITFETGKDKKKRIDALIIAPDQAVIQH